MRSRWENRIPVCWGENGKEGFVKRDPLLDAERRGKGGSHTLKKEKTNWVRAVSTQVRKPMEERGGILINVLP